MADFIDHIRRLRVLMQNMITRVVVDRSENAGDYQVLWGGDRVTNGIEHLEPQGLHFRAAKDAGGVVVSAGGQREAGVLLVAGGIIPNDVIGEGEGGLHYLATWRLFLRSDGTLCLGSKEPADWVSLASKVDSELTKIKADLDALKSSYDAHMHQAGLLIWPGGMSPAPVTGTSGAPVTPAPTPHSPETVASQRVRTE